MKYIKLFESFKKHVGDCFEVHGRFMSIGTYDYRHDIDIKYHPDMRLAHGIAIHEIDGKPFSHCWIELKDLVFDLSNDGNLKLLKDKYYSKGQIDPKTVILYTQQQVFEKIEEEQTWGPWKEFYKLNKTVDR